MSKFQLYINNQRVELFDDESVSLTETIQDIRDVSKVFTDFTKPFNLPASDTNNKIFKHYYRFNISQGYTFDARKKISAKIELNTIPFKDGKIRLEGVDLENGKPRSYRVTFFGNTVNLKDVLGEDEISGLSWLSNFNTTYSPNEIKNTLISSTGKSFPAIDGVVYDHPLIVPLISNSARFYYSSTTEIPYVNSDGSENLELGGNLYPTNPTNLGPNDVHGVYYEDLTYAIKVHLIVKAIENQYNEITFSDDFFDLTNGPDQYKKLYMLCQRKEGRIYDDIGTAVKQITTFPLVTQNNNVQISNGTNVLIFGLNPNQTVLGTWTINTQQAYPTFKAIIKEGTEVVLEKEFATGTNSIATISQQLTNSSVGYSLYIETTSAFGIASLEFVAHTPNGNQYSSMITSSQFPAIDIPFEKEFIISNNIPTMKVIDFLTGLFKMFNLTAFQQDGIIHVKTLESFYNSGSVRDITEFVDPTTISIDKALPYREIEFKYEDTGTTLAKQHKEIQGSDWGGMKYRETGDLNSNDQTFEVVAPFSHLKYERLNGVNTDIQWGFMADEKNEPYFEKPVLLLAEYVTLQSTNKIRFLEGKSGVTSVNDLSNYWMPSNSISRDATVSKKNIHFNLELNEWTTTSDFTETLFDQFYRFYISGIFNSAKRLTRINARLPKKFILNYTLADTVTINQNKYKINSITTNLLTGSSQLELLNETVNDAAVTQSETGGSGGQTGAPLTNVLTLYECDSPNGTYESTTTLATLNLAINVRVEDGSGNTYRVVGNNVPNTHTSKAITSLGLTGCPTTNTPPATNYYGLKRCSDNETNLRTASDVGNPTYAISQQVFDGSNVKYVIENATAQDTVPSVTITSTPSPVQSTCSGNTTANYYALNPCCSGTTLYGFSVSNSKSGTYLYNGQSYIISPSNNSGTIDIDSLTPSSCTTYYYSLNSCTDGSIQHYGTSTCSNLNNTQLTYSGTCYSIQNTTNTSGSINLDTLSSCSCTNVPVYYVLRDCDTASAVVTTTTTTDLSLNVSSTLANASRVQDASTGKCYTATGTTTDLSLYSTQIGQVSDLGVNDCPTTPCTNVQYYQLQQCSTGSTSYISGQTTTQISLNTNDMVHSGSTSGPLYKVLGTTSSGSSVGNVVPSSATACPTYYELQQCQTLQGQYRSNNDVTQISLNVNDRVQDPNGQNYTVVTVGVSGGGYANVGDVTSASATGCPSITPSTQYWKMDRCSDGSTGYLSLQTTTDISFNPNDTVTSGGARYQIVGADTINNGTQIGVIVSDGGNNCLTPVTPPVQPPATIYYARFINCDDPLGNVVPVYSSTPIGTWWVIQPVGSFECYRWLDNGQGVNPTELNSTNYNFFTSENTAGANCLDCQSTVPVPPTPPPTPPTQTCFTVALYKGNAPLDICSETNTRDIYLNASSLPSASQVYTDDTCSTLLGTDRYFTEFAGGDYYFWNASAATLTGPFTSNCP